MPLVNETLDAVHQSVINRDVNGTDKALNALWLIIAVNNTRTLAKKQMSQLLSQPISISCNDDPFTYACKDQQINIALLLKRFWAPTSAPTAVPVPVELAPTAAPVAAPAPAEPAIAAIPATLDTSAHRIEVIFSHFVPNTTTLFGARSQNNNLVLSNERQLSI